MTAPVEDERLKPLPMVSAWLAAQHAQHQESIADILVLGLFPLWQIMRFTELDASTALWLPAVLPRVETAYLQSQRLSAAFNANVRFAELATESPLLIDAPDVEFPSGYIPRWAFDMPVLDEPGVEQPRVELEPFRRQEVAQSLVIQANYNTKAAMPGPEQELMHDALVRSSGAAVRQALNGGRSVTDRVMKKDRKVIGFARVTDANPCALCALLASRGAVYGKGSFIEQDKKWKLNEEAARDVPDGWTNVAKIHDNCRCQLRPVYANESRWDAGAKHYLKLWNDLNVTSDDVQAVLKRKPNLKGYKLNQAAQRRAYRRAVDNKPFKGNQFDLNLMRNDLQERMNGLLDAGFSPNSPQVRWAERTTGLVA